MALHLACQALHLGDCDSAVVGATNLIINPETAMSMSRIGLLAADGQSRTFDADAHGYARAEGSNAVYIKRFSDALKDGDNIRAVIRAVAINGSVPFQSIMTT